MSFPYNDRTRVSSIRIDRGQSPEVYERCWVAIDSKRGTLGIWRRQDGADPEIVVPLDQAMIEWSAAQDLICPMP